MLRTESRILLPVAPADQVQHLVAAWSEPVVIDTYAPEAPGRYPAYLDSRVYQGSSGRVYPLPFHERIRSESAPHNWHAVHLENEYVRLMILPELGGRIHIGFDKTNGYDFFYRNEVIKPALVGLTGPWLAGGVEFNWPQHHRPATFLPTSSRIEREADGAVTVWCSDHDPFARMKGMHGVRLRPGSSVIELRVRLYNRSEQTETFLWWANVAARAGANYQSFFPTDVRVVADHAKRAITTFPAADRPYYGIDYPARRGLDRHPGSDLTVPGDRIDWYRNIPVPTSYMCLGTEGDFFGGYDHGARAGFVHYADHRIVPGKKQWTWGNAAFGRAWDRNLSDDGAAYVELMAGAFTDNQPDFTFLVPGETKTFSQFWYPIQEIGPVQQATTDAALHVDVDAGRPVALGVAVTRVFSHASVEIRDAGGRVAWKRTADLAPDRPFTEQVALANVAAGNLEVVVIHEGAALVRWRVRPADLGTPLAEPAHEPLPPAEIETVDELYGVGVHLLQYRHATWSPEPYWREALARDPGHAPTAVALAAVRYRDGRYSDAERFARRAIERLTALNANPADTEAFYLLGLALMRLGRAGDAEDAFVKATWDRAWRAPAEYQLARLFAARGENAQALARAEAALRVEPEHLQARDLRVLLLRRLGRHQEASAQLEETLELDPLDLWACDLAGYQQDADAQICLDVALEYCAIGETVDALRMLDVADAREREAVLGAPTVRPLIAYYRAELLESSGQTEVARAERDRARDVDATWCFPGRLDDADVLARQIDADPSDSRAHALFGHWLYAHERRGAAMHAWSDAVAAGSSDPVVVRNLGLGSFNHDGDPAAARRHYEAALALAPHDSRLLFEYDQLLKRTGEPGAARLARLEVVSELIAERDDLTIEYVNLLIDSGDCNRAGALLADRSFQPWEGGEGQVLAAWERVCLALADCAIADGMPERAIVVLDSALTPPENLGEARHALANDAALRLAMGDAQERHGDRDAAVTSWTAAATFAGDFHSMSSRPFSEMTFFSILAWERLGERERARHLMAQLQVYRAELAAAPVRVDYFATSLPNLLLFTDDLDARRDVTVILLAAQLALLNGDIDDARALRQRVLDADPNHSAAIDLGRQIDARSEGAAIFGDDDHGHAVALQTHQDSSRTPTTLSAPWSLNIRNST
jgi:tetratricopeptide (TPR) repeat protein